MNRGSSGVGLLFVVAIFLSGCPRANRGPGLPGEDTRAIADACERSCSAKDVTNSEDTAGLEGDASDSLDTDGMDGLSDPKSVDEALQDFVDPTLDSDGDGLPNEREEALGTDPLHPDTDRDGISDGQEVQDGTDPADPSSALAWHPEFDHHPRLFFGAKDLGTLRARTHETKGPWAALWSRILADAAQEPLSYPNGSYDITVSAQWGAIAEAAAFVGLLREDLEATQKALAILARESPDPSDLSPMSNYQLYESEALVSLCTAWDYLAGNPLSPPEALAEARAGLRRRLDTFRWMCHEGPSSWLLMLARNNHAMKVFGALGLCALALNDRPDAARDLSEAMTGLDYLLNHHQGTPDGGYAEGWNYLQYGSESFLPFFAAYHRWAQGSAFPYFGVPTLQIGSPHAGQIVWIEDFAVHPVTRAIYRRALWSVRPDGLTPETDDANPAPLNGAILAWLFDDPAFLWAWFQPAVNWFSGRLHTATFALYDGAEPPPDPGMERDGAPFHAGFAVFRQFWSPEAVYLVLQGEHGPVRLHGAGHEHADELSLMLWAHGAPLILDPGYINWPNHHLVRYPSDHNTILVEGKGAPVNDVLDAVGVDAFLTPMRREGFLTWVSVKTAYEGAVFRRRVVRVSERFFVVEDRISGPGGPRRYSLLWNGYGGGDVPGSSFALLPNGARWDGPEAWVEVHTTPVSGGPAELAHDLQEHVTTFGQWALHERLIATRVMDDPSGFLTLLVPGRAGEADPVVTLNLRQDGVAEVTWSDGDSAYLVLSNQTPTDFTVLGWYQVLSAPPGLTVQAIRLQDGHFSHVVETHHLPPTESLGG